MPGCVQEAYSGKGLFPGEAYAPNVPALIEDAAKAPAPLGAALIKLAEQVAPAGAPQVLIHPFSLHASLLYQASLGLRMTSPY